MLRLINFSCLLCLPLQFHNIDRYFSPQFGFVHLSLPLYMVAQFAMAQREELLKIIAKKDKEIEDYRLQNVKTSRRKSCRIFGRANDLSR